MALDRNLPGLSNPSGKIPEEGKITAAELFIRDSKRAEIDKRAPMTSWYVITPHGVFRADGISATAAISRFRSAHKVEIFGVLREDLVVMPPGENASAPFRCALVQGSVTPLPIPEGGK